MTYLYDRSRVAASMRLGPGRLDARATAALRQTQLKAKSDGRSLNAAAVSAGLYAKKMSKTMYVFEGNSFMHRVFRVSDNPSEYLNPVSNTGDQILSVTPELEVYWHDVDRPR